MKSLMNLSRNKWTSTHDGVHFHSHCDGQHGGVQVIDFAEKVCRPFYDNLGVAPEGTLPGKA
jgi:hypothetical protein